MINSVLSDGRLCGLTPSDWSVLLGSFVLRGLLTLVFWYDTWLSGPDGLRGCCAPASEMYFFFV
jgi:hypothetical protein